jgi:hypothetical protein
MEVIERSLIYCLVYELKSYLEKVIMFLRNYFSKLVKGGLMDRIHLPITESHLNKIRDSALKELDRFLNRSGTPAGKFSVYKKKLVGIFLCQGAAQHYLDYLGSKNGIVNRQVYVKEEEV